MEKDQMSSNYSGRERASIGPSISIKGEVTGAEDLLIEGVIEGKITLKDHSVTIGKNARVNADIFGKSIHVEGEVIGNLFGAEYVVVHASGYVRGDITAPRLSLEDGARLKGSIDTDPRAENALTKSIERTRPATSETPEFTPRVEDTNGQARMPGKM